MKKQHSIKWKLIFLFTSISTLPVIILGGLVIYFTSKSLENEINVKNLLLSKIYINQVEKYLDEPLKDLRIIREIIDSHGINSNTFVLFNELLGRHEYFVKFVLTNENGYVSHVFPQDENLVGSDMSRRSFFKNVSKSQKNYWSSVFISSPDNIPVTALSIPLPGAILTAHLNLSRLSEITGELSETEEILVAVTDQTGTYISHTEEIKVLQREMDSNYTSFSQKNDGDIFQWKMTHNGLDYICHIGFIRQTGWSVMISQPFAQTYLPVKKLLFVILSVTLIIFTISFFFSYRYGSIIKRTVDKFLESTSRIAGGRYDHSISGFEYQEFTELAENIYGMAKEIEEREKTILESQAMFRTVFQADAIGTSIINQDLTIEKVNSKWTEITGYSVDDLKDRTFLSLIHPDDAKQTRNILLGMLKGKESTERLEKRLVKKDGSEIWVDHTMALIVQDQGSPNLVGMLMDNTDRKKAQEEKQQLERKLQQAHKMEAVGSLAGGIAHDFNNILSAMLGYAEMASQGATPGSDLEKFLKEIRKAGNRAKDLVQQILSFSRQSETDCSIINPRQIIRDALKMLRPSIPTSIEISVDIPGDIGFVKANSAQLHQVIVNLCTNSFHAMEGTGGNISICLQRAYLDDNALNHVPDAKAGNFIRLTIQDSGPGIPDGIKDKIFDPYYTTKEFGKGSGMGLSIVHGIVTKHGGVISLDDITGPGTSFSVYLPLVDQIEEKLPQAALPIPTGSERILMVDDEEMLTNMGKMMLENQGYKVTTSNVSSEAVEIFKNNPDGFDLLISDQTMPQLTGIELSRQILNIRPNLPIILCTGYSSVVSKEEALAAGIQEFVYKPYSTRDISLIIRKIFDPKS